MAPPAKITFGWTICSQFLLVGNRRRNWRGGLIFEGNLVWERKFHAKHFKRKAEVLDVAERYGDRFAMVFWSQEDLLATVPPLWAALDPVFWSDVCSAGTVLTAHKQR